MGSGSGKFEVQGVPAASCQAFNTFLKDTGWTDFDGVVRKGWAAGTSVEIRWSAKWTQKRRSAKDGGVEVYIDQLLPGWYARKRVGRTEWKPSTPISEACGIAVERWIRAVEEHELAHAAAIDAMFKQANKKPIVMAVSATGPTEIAATKKLKERVNAKLAELAGPLREQIRADEAKYHEDHLVPLVECDAC